MKIITVLTEEEKKILKNVIDIDVCRGIDCSGLMRSDDNPCEGCPLYEAAELKEQLDKKLREILSK